MPIPTINTFDELIAILEESGMTVWLSNDLSEAALASKKVANGRAAVVLNLMRLPDKGMRMCRIFGVIQ